MPNVRELVKAIANGTATPPPIAKLIGFTVTLAENGKAIVEFQASERHANPVTHHHVPSSIYAGTESHSP